MLNFLHLNAPIELVLGEKSVNVFSLCRYELDFILFFWGKSLKLLWLGLHESCSVTKLLMSALSNPTIFCLILNNGHCVLPSVSPLYLLLITRSSHSFCCLPHLPDSTPLAHLCSIFTSLAWKWVPRFFAFLMKSSFHQPSGPDDMLGPSKDDRTVSSVGWVRRQLKHPLAHSSRNPTGLQQNQ